MPLAASGRLPERLAIHWTVAGDPDGSMPLWAAVFVPALIWLVLASGAVIMWRRTDAAPDWVPVGLTIGLILVGVQASIVHANLDRTDWHEARSVTIRIVAALAVASAAGLTVWLARRRVPASQQKATDGPVMDLPEGQRLVWFSRTSNPWMLGLSVVTGLAAVATLLVGAAGLTNLNWQLIAPLALVSILFLGCASVEARVSEKGLRVALGPFGWPARRWSVEDIESARSETRTVTQVGGLGYRINRLGTTVMLRSGECLVIRARGKDFAVSVDDAARGAALLNSWRAHHPSR